MKQFYLFFAILLSNHCYSQPGSLDLSFGTGGRQTTSFGTGYMDRAQDLAIQSDGKIIAAGTSLNPVTGLENFSLVRYSVTGSQDGTFGTGGLVETTPVNGFNCSGITVCIQSDGKILVAGHCNDTANSPTLEYFAVARYSSSGILDGTFGTGGISTIQLNVVLPDVLLTDMTIQPDGKIVICGGAYISSAGELLFVRIDSTGMPDPTFGTSGISALPSQPSGVCLPTGISIQSDGKIVFSGIIDAGSTNFPLIGRLNSDGTLETSFGTNSGYTFPTGFVSTTFNDVCLQPDGRIVVSGSDYSDALISRFLIDGSADSTFGISGTLTVPVGTGQATLEQIEILPDGKLIAGGSCDTGFVVIKATAGGTPDPGFATGGIAQTSFPATYFTFGNAIAIQMDGKIICAGETFPTSSNPPQKYALARYNNTISLSSQELRPDMNYQIFPNPASTVLQFSFNKIPNKISIHNSLGQEITRLYPVTNQLEMNIEAFKKGVYIVYFDYDTARSYTKVVIE